MFSLDMTVFTDSSLLFVVLGALAAPSMADPGPALRRICVSAAALLAAGAPAVCGSQADYPTRPIKIVVPLVPGAAADILPRIIAERLATRFGQSVVVENRPGANGNIGAEFVAHAAPDGYTLLATPQSPLITNESLYPRLGFDPRAFVPITIIATLPNVLVGNAKAPYATLQELLAFAKAHPDRLNYGSPGVGSSPHLAMEWIKHLSGIQAAHVPYNGIPPVLKDVIAGHVDLTFANAFTVLSLVKEGQLRALGVDSAHRIPELPDVPTLAETFPGYVVTAWFAMVAPPKTPPEVAERLSRAVEDALEEPDVATKLRDLAAMPGGGSPAQTAAFMNAERERWREVVTSAGLKTD